MLSFLRKSLSLSAAFAAYVVLPYAYANDEAIAQRALESGQYKEAIISYKKLLSLASLQKKGDLLNQLAFAYYRDQDDVAAFSTFLEALDTVTPPVVEPTPSMAEQKVFDEAMEIYLDNTNPSPRELAMKLHKACSEQLEAHPDYKKLNFFEAVAYANMGMFDQFFGRFYSSYKLYPSTYIALKTRGVLHLKLFERLSDQLAREKQRQLALEYLQKARAAYPKDGSLYKLLILFAPESHKDQIVKENVKTIIDQNIIVPRYEVSFFVQEAIRIHEYELARQFIDKARGWYQFSRVVQAAQELLESKETKQTAFVPTE